MIPQYGHLVAYPASNILIISDRASNVNRMMRIIRRIDQVGEPGRRDRAAAERRRGRGRARGELACTRAAAGRRGRGGEGGGG